MFKQLVVRLDELIYTPVYCFVKFKVYYPLQAQRILLKYRIKGLLK